MKHIFIITIAILLTGCGRLELNGPIVGASVSIFHSSEVEPIYTTQTDPWTGDPEEWLEVLGAGYVDLREVDLSEYISKGGYFTLEISGGERTGDDFEQVNTSTESMSGTVNMIVPARDAEFKLIKATGITQVAYQAVKPLLDSDAGLDTILAALDSLARDIVLEDLTKDDLITYADLLRLDYFKPERGRYNEDDMKALAEATFDGDSDMLSAETGNVRVCNYTQKTPGGQFAVCQTNHNEATCAAEIDPAFNYGHCAADGIIGTCTGEDTAYHYYSGTSSELAFGCNFVPGGVWTTP